MELVINPLDWKPHHIEVTTFQSRNSNIPNPFLNAVSSCFVKRFVVVYIIIDFFVSQFSECDICTNRNLADKRQTPVNT